MILGHYNPNINLPFSSFQALVLIRPLWAARLSSVELYLLEVLTPWPPRNQKARCDRELSLPAVRLGHEALANPALKEFPTPGFAADHLQAPRLPVGEPWEKLSSTPQKSPEPQTLSLLHSPPGRLAEKLLTEKTHHNFQAGPMPNCTQLIAKIFYCIFFIIEEDQISKLTQTWN